MSSPVQKSHLSNPPVTAGTPPEVENNRIEIPVKKTLLPVAESSDPVITLFKANRHTIALGKPIRLSWEVMEADEVRIHPANERLPASGMMDVLPDRTTEYVLTSRNEIGTKSLTIAVTLPSPTIAYFEATETDIQIGYPTILHWEVENGAEISLNMGIGDVTGRSFIEAYLKEPGLCTLTVSNPSGIATASLELFLPLPEIQSFFASSKVIRLGAPMMLDWQVNNAETIVIDQEIGEVTELLNLEIFPEKTTTYRISAINASGSVHEEVQVALPAPDIRFFEGDSGLSTEGEAIELSWEVENAFRITIDQGIGEVLPSGHISVKPQQPYTLFTLTAEGHSGMARKSFQLLRFPIPIEQSLLPVNPEFNIDMNANEKEMERSFRDLEEMESEIKRQTKVFSKKLHINKVKEMNLNDDLVSMKRASLRREVNILLKKAALFFTPEEAKID